MTAKEIIQKMVDEMPYDLERKIVPYIEEAMSIYAKAKAKEAFEAAREPEYIDTGDGCFEIGNGYFYPDYETFKKKP